MFGGTKYTDNISIESGSNLAIFNSSCIQSLNTDLLLKNGQIPDFRRALSVYMIFFVFST